MITGAKAIALSTRQAQPGATCAPCPDTLVPILTRLVETFADSTIIERCRFKALKRRPGSRHVALYELVLADLKSGQRNVLQLIAKRDTTHAAGKAVREFEAIRLLEQAGFDQDKRFKVPKLIHLSGDQRLLFQERARGAQLPTLVGEGSQTSRACMRMAGLWLARLHSCRVTHDGMCEYHHDLTSLRLFVDELTAVHPALAPRLQALEVAIVNKLASFGRVPLAMVHGDYHPEHIFVASDSATAIDFERFCLSDPAKDVGSFIAHIRTLAYYSHPSPAGVDRDTKAFLCGYLQGMPIATAATLSERVAVFVAHAALEALYYVASILRVSDRERIQVYLRCAEESGVLGRRGASIFASIAELNTSQIVPGKKRPMECAPREVKAVAGA